MLSSNPCFCAFACTGSLLAYPGVHSFSSSLKPQGLSHLWNPSTLPCHIKECWLPPPLCLNNAQLLPQHLSAWVHRSVPTHLLLLYCVSRKHFISTFLGPGISPIEGTRNSVLSSCVTLVRCITFLIFSRGRLESQGLDSSTSNTPNVQCLLYRCFIFCCILLMCVCVAQLCPTVCDPMDYSLPGSSVRGIFQARTLEWVVISFSTGSSWPRDQTVGSCVLCIGSDSLLLAPLICNLFFFFFLAPRKRNTELFWKEDKD